MKTTNSDQKCVGSPLANIQAQAAKLGPQNGLLPVVGRLYHSPRRYSYVIRFQAEPTAQDLEYGVRFEPVV